VVCAAVIATTPYALDYDLVVLLPALAWLWIDGRRNGFLPWDASLMALVWAAPLIARNLAQFAFVPLGLISVLAVAAIAMRRVRASPSRR
jgi:alpha-1,2-mannosyltransferase